jgi:hypothetical protein
MCVQGRHGADWAGERGPLLSQRAMIRSMPLAASRAEVWGENAGVGSATGHSDVTFRPLDPSFWFPGNSPGSKLHAACLLVPSKDLSALASGHLSSDVAQRRAHRAAL